MKALNYYISEYGYIKTMELLRKKVISEDNANLKAFFSNCLDRIGSIDRKIIKKLDLKFYNQMQLDNFNNELR